MSGILSWTAAHENRVAPNRIFLFPGREFVSQCVPGCDSAEKPTASLFHHFPESPKLVPTFARPRICIGRSDGLCALGECLRPILSGRCGGDFRRRQRSTLSPLRDEDIGGW